MMNGLIRTIFFLSAFAPAVLVSAVLHFVEVGGTVEVLSWIAASSIACVFPLLVVKAATQRSAQLPFAAKKIESQDWLLVVFVVSYFLPLITKTQDLQVFIPIFLMAAVLLATLDAIPCHPVLHVMRYRFYKVEGHNGTVYTLITRRRLLSAADIKNVRQLSPQLLMED
jgi:hypothetical protein